MPTPPASRILILPGWQNSGPDHWQSRWERVHGYRRVEQSDWMCPLRGDWIARLEEVLLESDVPAVLVAHSLGCLQSRSLGRPFPKHAPGQGRDACGAAAG